MYSGRVYAHVNEGWQYGYFEASIKLPKGKGTWPAFWMMPVGNDWNTNPWPMCGEIDIMEEVGVVPNEVSSSVHTQDYNHTWRLPTLKVPSIPMPCSGLPMRLRPTSTARNSCTSRRLYLAAVTTSGPSTMPSIPSSTSHGVATGAA